jgi:xanthine/CO dehydrogenase XdhC/CoxF family maturation factor
MREIGDIVRQYERRQRAAVAGPSEMYALATLVRAQGSSYRRPGARMMVAVDGSAVGSLSGGCLEEEVIVRAREVLRTGTPAWMEFDTRRRFGCHGSLEIFIERVGPGFFARLADCYHARRSIVLATCFARAGVETGTRFVDEKDGTAPETFVQRIAPPVQLLVIGDGPDSGALRSFGETLGWSVMQLDCVTDLRGGDCDEWTAAIVKTHNYGRDCAALRALLPLGLRYIGLLGPRRRRDQLVGDILDSGVEVNGSVFGPAGLDLGGDAPEAIALSIIAEIQAVFAGGSGQSLRDRRAPIHATLTRDAALAF